MNKYEFIADLLENNKLDTSQREKVFKLIANELKIEGNTQIQIEKRIKKIEDKIRDSQNLKQQKNIGVIENRQVDMPGFIDPIHLSNFLIAYNKDPILKYTCHEIDEDGLISILELCEMEEFELEKYHLKIASLFKELSNEHTIPKNIWTLIYSYLNGGKEWSSDKIKLNWQSHELLEWSKRNKGFVPSPDNSLISTTNNIGFDFLPFKSKVFDNTIGSFSSLVIHFKNLFHIRADNSLKKMIEIVNVSNGWDSKIKFTVSMFRDNVEFFTDVDKLLQSYKKIISIIIDVSDIHSLDRPIVELSLNEVNNKVLFSIHHKNTTYKKTIKNTLERIGQKHSELIKNQINGLCNLYIQADFDNNEFARINLWDGKERNAEIIDKVSGVNYQLIFN